MASRRILSSLLRRSSYALSARRAAPSILPHLAPRPATPSRLLPTRSAASAAAAAPSQPSVSGPTGKITDECLLSMLQSIVYLERSPFGFFRSENFIILACLKKWMSPHAFLPFLWW
jgi:hypothetical protein